LSSWRFAASAPALSRKLGREPAGVSARMSAWPHSATVAIAPSRDHPYMSALPRATAMSRSCWPNAGSTSPMRDRATASPAAERPLAS
jgi:hypothetical protein